MTLLCHPAIWRPSRFAFFFRNKTYFSCNFKGQCSLKMGLRTLFSKSVLIQIEACLFNPTFYKVSHSKGPKQRALHVHQTKTKHFIAKLFAHPIPSTLGIFEFVWVSFKSTWLKNKPLLSRFFIENLSDFFFEKWPSNLHAWKISLFFAFHNRCHGLCILRRTGRLVEGCWCVTPRWFRTSNRRGWQNTGNCSSPRKTPSIQAGKRLKKQGRHIRLLPPYYLLGL